MFLANNLLMGSLMRRRSFILACALVGWLVAPTPASGQTTQRDFTILLANDDGYRAPGLQALIDSLAPHARIFVAAPLEQQSGTGHGITYRDPIMLRRVMASDTLTFWAIGARPATVVRVALESLLETPPDLVISGINAGENIGLSAWLSGTVAAAREAAFLGAPAIAVSMAGNDLADYAAAAGYTKGLVRRLRRDGTLRRGVLLNVNVPAGIAGKPLPETRVTRQSLANSRQRYERHTSPRGQEYLWDNWEPPADDAEGTDLHAFARGFITVTPLKIDQTDGEAIPALRRVLEVGGER